MVWDIVSKKFKFPPRSEVSDLHWRLLLSYLGVMSVILAVFAGGTYLFVSHSFYRQLDRKLLTLAQAATPFHTRIQQDGTEYLDRVDEVPWRDIFNRDSQSLEWFDAQGRLLATRGELTVDNPPETGSHTRSMESSPYKIRSYTISVFRDRATSEEPSLEGYIRASQSTEEVQESQRQLLWGLITGGTAAVILSGMGGVWLTRKALAPLEKNLRQLRQFTADASHELRSPLAVIKSSVQIMQNHPERFQEKDLRKVNAIASATEQMGNLVENLLFLARTDANNASKTPSQRQLSLEDILQDLVELFEASAEEAGVTLNLEIREDAKVMGDGEQLYRLFANFLRNALQHTPEGGSVTIRVTVAHRSCQVSVIDTGVGISAEEQALVFERFWRADRARSQSQGGTGLGLPIASAIAAQHGGKITVTSTVGKGSCFTVRLPTIQARLSPS